MSERLIDDLQGRFRTGGGGYVGQIFTLKQIGEKAQVKNCRVCVGFMDLGKAYNRVNREALWQVLKIYDVGGKLLNGIKSRQVCIMSRWLFNVYKNAEMKKVKMRIGSRRVSSEEEGREWRLHCLFYTVDLVLCDESEEDLREKLGRFIEECRR